MTRLRSYDISPPGGYRYRQDNIDFPSQPMIEAQARIIEGWRKGNGKPRASYKEALIDVDRYMANTVLQSNPRFTVTVPDEAPETIALPPTAPGLNPCQGCGAPLE